MDICLTKLTKSKRFLCCWNSYFAGVMEKVSFHFENCKHVLFAKHNTSAITIALYMF